MCRLSGLLQSPYIFMYVCLSSSKNDQVSNFSRTMLITFSLRFPFCMGEQLVSCQFMHQRVAGDCGFCFFIGVTNVMFPGHSLMLMTLLSSGRWTQVVKRPRPACPPLTQSAALPPGSRQGEFPLTLTVSKDGLRGDREVTQVSSKLWVTTCKCRKEIKKLWSIFIQRTSYFVLFSFHIPIHKRFCCTQS